MRHSCFNAATRFLASALATVSGYAQGASTSTLDWPSYGNDLGGMRYVNADQISPANVANLRPAWIMYTGILGEEASFESQPIVLNGTMYVTSPHGHVFALDAATGAIKWTYTPDMPPIAKLSYCCGQTNRGVAVGNGKVFLAQLDSNLVALDATTGSVAWKVAIDPWQEGWTETMAPLFVDGKVLVGASGGEFLRRGHVSAYDANTGNMLWRFFTVPGPGELGNDTWTGNSWMTGGGTVWTTPAADTNLGLLYITTGNAAPDENGFKRAGNNLFTCSVVALDLNTGKYKWHFQEVHHDIWDYDSTQPVHLFTFSRNGQQIPALGHANKDGYYFILDRRDGTPLFKVTETAVPTTQPSWQNASPTQPVPSIDELIPHTVAVVPAGLKAAPFWTPPQEEVLLMQPGFEAGPEWAPSAFSPRTGFAYIDAGGVEPWLYHALPASLNTIGSTGVDKIPGIENYGLLDAIDTTTGKMAWQIKTPEKIVSGVVVAGDLVFFGESQGKFNAVDAKTGKNLWSYEIPKSQQDKSSETNTASMTMGGANAAPAVYMVNGREYVVMAFGGNTQVRSNAQVSNPGDALVAFALPAAGVNEPHIVSANVKDVELGEVPDQNKIAGVDTPPPDARVVPLDVQEFDFLPGAFTVAAGEKVAVHLVNHDVGAAGIAIDLPSGTIALKDPVDPGKDTYFVFTAPSQAGVFTFINTEAGFAGNFGSMRVAPACTSTTLPCISSIGVVNAADFRSDGVAPGEIISVFGAGLGPDNGQAQDFNPASGTIGTSVAGTQVMINGVAAPVLFAQSNQVNAIVPMEVSGKDTASLQIVRNGANTPEVTLTVASAVPSIFAASSAGQSQAIAENANGTLNTTSNPAAKGSTIRLFANGLGQTTPASENGKLMQADAAVQLAQPLFVLIGGVNADIVATKIPAGLFSGVVEIDVRIPQNAAAGPGVPVQVIAGRFESSPGVLIALQ